MRKRVVLFCILPFLTLGLYLNYDSLFIQADKSPDDNYVDGGGKGVVTDRIVHKIPSHLNERLQPKKEAFKPKMLDAEDVTTLKSELKEMDSDLEVVIADYNDNLDNEEARAELEKKFESYSDEYGKKLSKLVQHELAIEAERESVDVQ